MTYFVRRLLITLPVLFGVTTLTFFLIHLVPGDPVDIMLGEQASALDRDALREELGLNRPLSEQYLSFYRGLFTFDLGRSMRSKAPVADEIRARIPATVELTLGAMALALFVGLPLGVIAAVRKNSWIDRLVSLGGLVGISVPGFWLGPMLILAFSIHLDLLPVSERGGIANLILPALTLASGLTALLIQMTRASMLEVVKEDFMRAARAKGLSPFILYFKHALANALMPIITVIGMQFGALLTGTVIIETIFDWPGLGTLLYQAIQERNYPLVQGCVLFITGTYVIVNLVTDLAYAAADPRVRLS